MDRITVCLFICNANVAVMRIIQHSRFEAVAFHVPQIRLQRFLGLSQMRWQIVVLTTIVVDLICFMRLSQLISDIH